MPERLELTKNAQFYIPNNPIDDSIVNEILEAAVGNMDTEGDFVVESFRAEKNIEESDLNYRYSIRVFPSTRPVSMSR